MTFLFGISLSANADGGVYLNPLFSLVSNSQSSSIESLKNFPIYSCKVKVELSVKWGFGASASCEGGGTSQTSATDACDQAYEALSACMTKAYNIGFRRSDVPRSVPPLRGYGEW